MASSFTVNNAAAVAKLFSVGPSTTGGNIYIGADSTGPAPQQALVKHTFGLVNGKNDKHLLQFSQSRIDSATATAGKVTVTVTITVPPLGATTTDVNDAIAFAKNFLADSTLVSKLESGII
jgi:hypothetical protein